MSANTAADFEAATSLKALVRPDGFREARFRLSARAMRLAMRLATLLGTEAAKHPGADVHDTNRPRPYGELVARGVSVAMEELGELQKAQQAKDESRLAAAKGRSEAGQPPLWQLWVLRLIIAIIEAVVSVGLLNLLLDFPEMISYIIGSCVGLLTLIVAHVLAVYGLPDAWLPRARRLACVALLMSVVALIITISVGRTALETNALEGGAATTLRGVIASSLIPSLWVAMGFSAAFLIELRGRQLDSERFTVPNKGQQRRAREHHARLLRAAGRIDTYVQTAKALHEFGADLRSAMKDQFEQDLPIDLHGCMAAMPPQPALPLWVDEAEATATRWREQAALLVAPLPAPAGMSVSPNPN